jgi:hypothetical protein
VTDKGNAGNPAKDAAGAKGTGCINPNNRPFDSHPSRKIQAVIGRLAADLIPCGIEASARVRMPGRFLFWKLLFAELATAAQTVQP